MKFKPMLLVLMFSGQIHTLQQTEFQENTLNNKKIRRKNMNKHKISYLNFQSNVFPISK